MGLNSFAWAMSRTPVAQPSNPGSSFGMHNSVGLFTEPLTSAKNAQGAFGGYVKSLGG